MNSRVLLVDAGNSRVKWAEWLGGEQRPVLDPNRTGRLKPLQPLTELGSCQTPGSAAERTGLLRDLRASTGGGEGLRVGLASVVPAVVDLLRSDLSGVSVVDHTAELPFVMGVDEPARVGPDRLCNMAAAAGAGLASALVVDAGTATTFDLLLDGEFVGGMIAPGMAFAARKLGEAAPMLDPVAFGPTGWDVGRNTTAAMAAGAWHAGTGGIRAIIDGLQQRYGPVPVILTGGLGAHIADGGMSYDPHWTLRGIAVICRF